MAFDVGLEQDVVAHCLRDRAYLAKAAAVLEGHPFSTEPLVWLWGVLHEVYVEHRELAAPGFILMRLDKDFPDASDAEHMESFLESMSTRSTKSPKAALAEIKQFVTMTATRRTADKILDGIDEGDIDAAAAALEEGAASVRRVAVISPPVSLSGGAAARLTRYTTPIERGRVAKTPIYSLNRLCFHGGGLPIGKVGSVMSTTNVGKTTFLVDLGYTGARDGLVVLHITSEDEAWEVEKRYDARLTGIGRSKLSSGSLSEREIKAFEEAYEAHAHLNDRIKVHKVPKGHKVTVIDPLLQMVREDYPDAPLLLLYDSPFHAVGPGVYREVRNSFRAVIEHVDNVVREPSMGYGDVMAWVTWQGRRKDTGKVPTSESGGESYDIARTVDIEIGLREGDNYAMGDGGSKVIEAWITRNRIGEFKKGVFYMKADLDVCKFEEIAHSRSPDDDDE